MSNYRFVVKTRSWEGRERVEKEPRKSCSTQLIEEFCLGLDLDNVKKKFKDESWFVDIFLTKPNYRFPFIHLCVVGKSVFDESLVTDALKAKFVVSAVEFVELVYG